MFPFHQNRQLQRLHRLQSLLFLSVMVALNNGAILKIIFMTCTVMK